MHLTKLHITSLVLSLSAIPVFNGHADTINISSDIWCPYICDENPGYVVELTNRAFELMGHEVQFNLMPFNRALLEAQKGNVDAVLAVTPKNLVDHQLHSGEMKIGLSYNDFYTLTTNKWRFTELEDLNQHSVAIISGYDYDAIQDHIDTNPDAFYLATGENPLAMNIKRLIRGRFQILLGNRNVISYTSKQLKMGEKIRYAGSFGTPLPLYIGFSVSKRHYADIFTEGMAKLKANGEYDKILIKYQIYPFD
ncbi:putative cation efflux protein [Shewanella denitrificans OS217]|uniref:Putative cation efflux protein n=1 Tax=Shewanella denitrificans (strain OS217 / ATCC BAA-1090 / DSM 15013) TaxID=318161 RepID=Q12S73_SHEDO|nr:transporter substrate-binding domain-containing protein [Shewanella denitrificans]ABE53703.1 putative cation efflux protein [Shewanella denitrificans OS217]